MEEENLEKLVGVEYLEKNGFQHRGMMMFKKIYNREYRFMKIGSDMYAYDGYSDIQEEFYDETFTNPDLDLKDNNENDN